MTISELIKSSLTLSIVLAWFGCSVAWMWFYVEHMPHVIWWLTIFLPVQIVGTVVAYMLHWLFWDLDV